MKLPRIFRRSNKPKMLGASNTDSRSATDDARVIRDTLAEFDIEAKVLEANVGHGVTSFLVQEMSKSFHFIRGEYVQWRSILEVPYREYLSIK